MKTITIRGINSQLDHAIKSRAQQNNLSMNQWILQALRKITGIEKKTVFEKHHDLDSLAGGWSTEETRAFHKNTQLFEVIDEEIWK